MTVAFYLLVFLLAMAALWCIVCISDVIRQQAYLTDAWMRVDETFIERGELLSELQALLREQGFEVFAAQMNQVCSLVTKDMELHPEMVRKRTEIQKEIGQQAMALFAEFDQHPPLGQLEAYRAMRANVGRLTHAIEGAVQRYNRGVVLYNAILKRKPNVWTVEWMGYVPAPRCELEGQAIALS